MTFIRSLIFNLFYVVWIALIAIIGLPIALISKGTKYSRVVPIIWAKGIMFLARTILNIDYEIRGVDNLIKSKGVLYAVKHQSAWETIIFWLICESPVYILKKELLNLPVLGWYFKYMVHTIAIDRTAGASALKQLINETKEHIAAGRQVIIFPEGTRTAPHATPDYQAGIAALYNKLSIPVTPVALNSGVMWGRNAFIKHSGTIIMEFLSPIESGLKRNIFSTELQTRIEDSSNRLMAEAEKHIVGDRAN